MARDIEDPETKASVWKRMQARAIASTAPGPRAEVARARRPAHRRARLGLRLFAVPAARRHPVAQPAFGGLDESDGIYHSIYDDYYHFTKFLDTDFAYGRALAQTVGTLVIRLADADVLPFQFTHLADTAQTYVRELQALLKERQDEVRERNRQIEDGVFASIADRRRPLTAPSIEEVPPALNFAPLENAANALTRAAERYRKALEAARSKLTPESARAVNVRLIQSERQLTDPAGLPRRPWYRHLLYAPGYYTGYAVKTMPGVREAIEEKNYAEADTEIVARGPGARA